MNQNVIKIAFSFLSRRDKLRITILTVVQSVLNLLDIFGVVVIGFLIALMVSGVQSQPPGEKIHQLLSFLGIENLPLQHQAFILGLLSVIFFVLKSILNIWLRRNLLRTLSLIASFVSENYANKIFNLNLGRLVRRSPYQYQYDIITGVNSLILETLGGSILLFTDLCLVVILVSTLMFVDTFVAVFTLISFGSIAFLLYKFLSVRTGMAGSKFTESSLLTSSAIEANLNLHQEIELRGSQDYFLKRINTSRRQLAHVTWKTNFYPMVGKYIFEATIIIFTISLAGIEFLLKDAVHALSVVAIFLASSSRIAPAILRIQQSATLIRASSGKSSSTIEFFNSVDAIQSSVTDQPKTPKINTGLLQIECRNLSYTYPESANFQLQEVSFSISKGSYVALTGPSGAGKTTLMQILLGYDAPTEGEILIEGLPPREFISRNPGLIGYVPQEVSIMNGTLLENILLGEEDTPENRAFCQELLKKVKLHDYATNLENGDDPNLTHFGQEMSGGQKQRLGIVRALLTKPSIIFLDEATSALDSETEQAISELMRSLHGRITFIVIAHRLSTVREADSVLYFEKGKLIGQDKFENLRKSIPEFDKQADILGIN